MYDDYINYDKPYIKPKIVSRPLRTPIDTVALVTVAKNEDDYIDEWIQYYTKLGFDAIYIYENNWRAKKPLEEIYPNVHLVPWDGEKRQIPGFNHFLQHHYQEFGYVADFDMDEILVLKEDTNIKDALKKYQDIPVLGIPWRMFGSNGQTEIVNNNYSDIDRFTKSSTGYAEFKKLIVNLNLVENRFTYADPHYGNIPATDPARYYKNVSGALFPNIHNLHINEPIELNHYKLRTFEEYYKRLSYGSAVFGPVKKELQKTKEEAIKWWSAQDAKWCQVDNFTAYNFFHDIKD